jgi:hypothetical protein
MYDLDMYYIQEVFNNMLSTLSDIYKFEGLLHLAQSIIANSN